MCGLNMRIKNKYFRKNNNKLNRFHIEIMQIVAVILLIDTVFRKATYCSNSIIWLELKNG